MIKNLCLGNFKCFEDASIPLERLTLLSGVNGSGKSSVIQSLLVLRQFCLRGIFSANQATLSGDLVDIGGAKDILFSAASEDIIQIELEFDTQERFKVVFSIDKETGEIDIPDAETFQKDVRAMSERGIALFNGGNFGEPQVAAFNYLNAERYGPRKALPVDSRRGRLFDLGKHGEHVLDALLHNRGRITLNSEDPRHVSGAAGDRLLDQIEAWLNEISPGVQLVISSVPQADMAVGAFSFAREGALRSPDYRATNVGFGLSYILPVLAGLLAAPRNGLVMIENPEAHLHPRGQTKMGELCARAAAAGVQVVIETHSDHVLDGARLAVRDGILDQGHVLFHYLRQEDGKAVRITPKVDAEGRLSEWPEGFFDQHRKNAARLVRPHRR